MLNIRPATLNDVPSIVRLNDALFREDAEQHDPTMNLNWAQEHGDAYFRKYFESATSIIFLAESDATAVGYLAGYLKPPSDYRPITRAELESIYVEPVHRSSGVGKLLTQEFVAWCRSRGATRIGVTAYAENTRAVAFYRAFGFQDKHITLELTVG